MFRRFFLKKSGLQSFSLRNYYKIIKSLFVGLHLFSIIYTLYQTIYQLTISGMSFLLNISNQHVYYPIRILAITVLQFIHCNFNVLLEVWVLTQIVMLLYTTEAKWYGQLTLIGYLQFVLYYSLIFSRIKEKWFTIFTILVFFIIKISFFNSYSATKKFLYLLVASNVGKWCKKHHRSTERLAV